MAGFSYQSDKKHISTVMAVSLILTTKKRFEANKFCNLVTTIHNIEKKQDWREV